MSGAKLSEKINVLVVGGGGREHALCWKIAQSPLADKVFCAPGNGGTAIEKRIENVDIGVGEFDKLTSFAKDNKVGLVVIGPDNPLADGIVDHMEKAGLKVFGPEKESAKLEWSKAHSKQFMNAHKIPTAKFWVGANYDDAEKFVRENSWARVIKADGLALGKGVFVCDSETEAVEALKAIFKEGRFGTAGEYVVIEEKLLGEELSLLLLIDGKNVMPLSACQDHKRRFDGDKGPNTGGMGAYSPVKLFDRHKTAIEQQVINPIEAALKAGTMNFRGMLFAGILVGVPADAKKSTSELTPYVLEFNARFGDPETQALMPRLKSDVLPLLWACANEGLSEEKIEWLDKSSVCVVLSTQDYPESSSKGKEIEIGELPTGAFLFHAGTANNNGKLVTNGGRVLALTALGDSIEEARENAYKALGQVKFADMSCRSDIALREVAQCLSK